MIEFLLSGRFEDEFQHRIGPIEFGSGPPRDGVARRVLDDPRVEPDHMKVEELANNRVRVENLATSTPIPFLDGTALEPGSRREFDLPVLLDLGSTRIDIEPAEEEASDAEHKGLSTLELSVWGETAAALPKKLRDLGQAPKSSTLARWFEQIILVQRAAIGSAQFYEQTARALVELIDLDQGIVLLRKDGGWEILATAAASAIEPRAYSRTILEQMAQNRRTYFQIAPVPALSKSLHGIEAVVASPIFDTRAQVIGALYGSRNIGPRLRGPGITPLEAQVVQLLASAVGVGLARLDSENHAIRRRILIEQVFSVELAQLIERDPDLFFEGRSQVVTVLFGDIRGFSRLSEHLGAEATCQLVADVMDLVTRRVHEQGGIIVDYQGDGFMAMWNAPVEQPDHAHRACMAAIAIQRDLPELSRRWEQPIGGKLGMGIGINTGSVIVGNTGSRLKRKYGPLGHPVNMASRVEGATKFFRVPVLLTGATREQLGESFPVRRLCQAHVVGIDEAVQLYELFTYNPDPEWRRRRDEYERGLAHFEAGDWTATCRTIHPLLEVQGPPYDVPSLNLIERAVQCLKSPPRVPFNPTFELTSK